MIFMFIMELTTETKNYNISIISRDEIPDDIFLGKETEDEIFGVIKVYQYEFTNGFKFIVALPQLYTNFSDVIEI